MSVNIKKHYMAFKHLRDRFLEISAIIQIHIPEDTDKYTRKYIIIEMEKINMSLNKILNKLKDDKNAYWLHN